MSLANRSFVENTVRILKRALNGNIDSAVDESEGWTITPELKGRQLTGRVIVFCDRPDVLEAFIGAMEAGGYKVVTPLHIPGSSRGKNVAFVSIT